ncbi:MAG TPA: hypothetical protein VLE53_11915 [Gemmatimonadaceae bacterium]|nr:hypothetical protein [Gemmatimonadaceae bacterium]
MSTGTAPDASTPRASPGTASGAAMAAFLAAGAGAFAVGFWVILSEAGVFAAPTLYGPAGGVSGRTTFGVLTWLIVWAVLHARWKSREVNARSVSSATLVLIVLGLLFTFPPVWAIFG